MSDIIDSIIYQQESSPDLNVICPECQYEKNAVMMRTVKGAETVQEIGIFCAGCNKWTHMFFLSPKLRAMRQQWDKFTFASRQIPGDVVLKNRANKAGKMFKQAFKNYNKMMRSRFGIEADNEKASVVKQHLREFLDDETEE